MVIFHSYVKLPEGSRIYISIVYLYVRLFFGRGVGGWVSWAMSKERRSHAVVILFPICQPRQVPHNELFEA